jgi:hypothetical protein
MLGVVVLLVGAAAGDRVGTQGGTISGQVMVRERANGDQSLLFSLNVPLSTTFDEIRLRGVGSFRFRTGLAPDGWTAMQDGGELRMRGMSTIQAYRFRFDVAPAGRDRLDQRLGGRELEARGFSSGRRIFELKMNVRLLPKVVPQETLETSLTVPRRVVQDAPFFVSASPGFTEGRWSYGYGNTWRDLATLDEARRLESGPAYEPLFRALGESPSRDRYRFETRLPRFDVAMTTRLGFSYDDEWGDTIVDAEASRTRIQPPGAACPANISGGAPMVFADQTLCLSGCFPQPSGPFTLNGMQMLHAYAGSPTSVQIHMPGDLMAGPGSIEMGGAPTPFRFRILAVLGSIDQNLLWKGESTTMRLEILGTPEPLPIEIVNWAPGVIDLEGGVRQVVSSSGGSSNALQRGVRGIQKGNFTISYRLQREPCGFDDDE